MNRANFCIQCGAKIDTGDNFCTSCGAEVELYEEDLDKYKYAIEKQVKKYEEKEKKVLDIIEKRFKPTELTYMKFTGTIATSREEFYNRVSAAMEIIEIFRTPEPAIEKEIKKEIKILEKITNKLNKLLIEFIMHPINDSEKKEETENLFDDLDNLINSVGDYK